MLQALASAYGNRIATIGSWSPALNLMPLGSNQSGIMQISYIMAHQEHLGARKKAKIKGEKMANSPPPRKRRRIDGEENEINQNPDRVFSTSEMYIF